MINFIFLLILLVYSSNLLAAQFALLITQPQSESIYFFNAAGQTSLGPDKSKVQLSPYLIKIEDIAFTSATVLNIEYENNPNAMSGLHEKQVEINILGFRKKILIDTDIFARHDIQVLKLNVAPNHLWKYGNFELRPKIGVGVLNSYLRVSSLDNSNTYADSSTGLIPYAGLDTYYYFNPNSALFFNFDHGQIQRNSKQLRLQDLSLGTLFKANSVSLYIGKTLQNLDFESNKVSGNLSIQTSRNNWFLGIGYSF